MATNRVTRIRELRANPIAQTARTGLWRNRLVWLLVVAAGFAAGHPGGALAVVTICDPSYGDVSPAPGTYPWIAGSMKAIQATPESYYEFKQWNATGGVSVADSYAASTMMTVTGGDGSLCPVFERIMYTVTVCTPTGGSVTPSPGDHSLGYGWVYTITATPASCYKFKQWNFTSEVHLNDPTAASAYISLTGNGTVCPEFELIIYTVTVCDAVGGIALPGPGENTYNCGAPPLPIQAIPELHYKFKQWNSSGGVTVANSGAASTTMTVTGDGTLCPVFEKKTTKVPSLVGVSESDIEATLNAAGLYLGTMSYGPSNLQPGLVVSQDPKAGTTVGEGTTVNVTISQAEEQGPVYLDVDARGKNNGSSWTDAFTALQDGLTAANIHRNLILVAEGVYKPDLGVAHALGDREASFQLKNGVTIKGGFAGFGKPNPDARDIGRYETVLSGNIGDRASNTDNSLHVVMAVKCDATTVLDGLTIADGNASLETTPDNRGAALFNNPGSLKVIDCTFRDNAAAWFGAGMYNNYSSKSEPNLIRCTFRNNTALNGAAVYSHSTCKPTFTDCLFQANIASAGGGAAIMVYQSIATLTDCNFVDNKAKTGAGVYGGQDNTTLINCTFHGNSATDNGGAVKSDKGTITVTDCTFTENSATRGGAVHCSNSSQSKLSGCVFVGNTASVHGGAIFYDTAETTIAGCTFLDNLAATNGGGLWIYNSDAWVVNCTFGGNSAKLAGGAGTHASESEFTGCVFSGNAATTDGGGLVVWNCTRPTSVANCTFSRNSATNRGGGVYDANGVATVSNCILWGNTAPQGPQITLASNATMTVQRCDVQDGQAKVSAVASTLTWGTGNLTSDPKFTDADGLDNKAGTVDDALSLLAASPCIDAGDNKQVPADVADVDGDGNMTERLPLDIAGRPRFVDVPASANTGVTDPPTYPAIVDMGAYERGS